MQLYVKHFEKSNSYSEGDDVFMHFYCPECNGKLKVGAELFNVEITCPSCQQQITGPYPSVCVGQQIKQFQIDGFIGQGANGEAYAGTDTYTDQAMVVKIVGPDKVNDQLIALFKQEYSILRKIDHPSIVKGLACGKDSNFFYFAMDRVYGESCDESLEREDIFPEKVVFHIIIKAAEALDYVWKNFKIIHSDLKPGNLMMDYRSQVYVMDWGLAQDLSGTADEEARDAMGTPLYMAPEVMNGDADLDCQADIYSLGVTCFEMLTGELPFLAETLDGLVEQVRNAPTPKVSQHLPNVNSALDELIYKMMARDRADRFQNWSELLRQLCEMFPENEEDADEVVLHEDEEFVVTD